MLMHIYTPVLSLYDVFQVFLEITQKAIIPLCGTISLNILTYSHRMPIF
jgi:hypothetical protein